MFRQFHPRFSVLANAEEETAHQISKSRRHRHRDSSGVREQEPRTHRGDIKFMRLELFSEHPQDEFAHQFSKSGRHRHRDSSGVREQEPRTHEGDITLMRLELFSEHPQDGFAHQISKGGRHRHRGSSGAKEHKPHTHQDDAKFMRHEHDYELKKEPENRRGGFRRHSHSSIDPTQMLEEGGHLISKPVEGKGVDRITDSGRPLRDRHHQADARNTNDSFVESKPSELIELRQTLTELNNAVIQIARSGKLEQALQVRDLLVQVKHEIDKFPVEQ